MSTRAHPHCRTRILRGPPVLLIRSITARRPVAQRDGLRRVQASWHTWQASARTDTARRVSTARVPARPARLRVAVRCALRTGEQFVAERHLRELECLVSLALCDVSWSWPGDRKLGLGVEFVGPWRRSVIAPSRCTHAQRPLSLSPTGARDLLESVARTSRDRGRLGLQSTRQMRLR